MAGFWGKWKKEVKRNRARAPRALQNDIEVPCTNKQLEPLSAHPLFITTAAWGTRLFTFLCRLILSQDGMLALLYTSSQTHSLAHGSAATPLQRPGALVETEEILMGIIPACPFAMRVCVQASLCLSLCHTHTHTLPLLGVCGINMSTLRKESYQ